MKPNDKITIETTINAPIDRVWECWTSPKHIVNWNFATKEWCFQYIKQAGRFKGWK